MWPECLLFSPSWSDFLCDEWRAVEGSKPRPPRSYSGKALLHSPGDRVTLAVVLHLRTPRPTSRLNMAEYGVQGAGYCSAEAFQKSGQSHIARQIARDADREERLDKESQNRDDWSPWESGSGLWQFWLS
jgi:hypothetical protein